MAKQAKKSTDTTEKDSTRRALFQAYKGKQSEVEEAEAATAALVSESDAIVAEIVKLDGGPRSYKLDGVLVTPRKRGDGYYFRGVDIDGAIDA